MKSRPQRIPWSHDELVIACGLYFTLPFGQMHARNPRIIEIAGLLGRTPSSIAMKLVNFASLDPAQRVRGIRGLAGHSHNDEQVWNEFQTNWDAMALECETRLRALQDAQVTQPARSPAAETFAVGTDAITEAMSTIKVRIMQSFFRKAVLAAYNSTCCVTGNTIEALLVASHILPWSEFPEERLNPSNGLCLAAHFDRAFDRGLITFDEHLRLVVSPAVRRHLPNEAIESEFLRREGWAIVCPHRFKPDPDFIAYHRVHVFRTA
jgi:putative restriction endonuclease